MKHDSVEKVLFWSALILGIATLLALAAGDLEKDSARRELAIAFGPALVLYALATRLHVLQGLHDSLPRFLQLCWGVRRRPVVDLILALGSGYVGFRISLFASLEDTWTQVLFAAVACLLGLYLASLFTTPRTAVAVINFPPPGGGGSAEEKRFARRYDSSPTYPLVWPYVLAAQPGGSVIWRLNVLGGGGGGTRYKAVIRFPGKHQPFGPERTVFEADVPGVIAAGPVVQNGCGGYVIEVRDENGRPVTIADPVLDVPRN